MPIGVEVHIGMDTVFPPAEPKERQGEIVQEQIMGASMHNYASYEEQRDLVETELERREQDAPEKKYERCQMGCSMTRRGRRWRCTVAGGVVR